MFHILESSDELCEQFDNFLNEKRDERIRWQVSMLDKDDERRNLTDRQILEKNVYLEKSCLSDIEKKQVMDKD